MLVCKRLFSLATIDTFINRSCLVHNASFAYVLLFQAGKRDHAVIIIKMNSLQMGGCYEPE